MDPSGALKISRLFKVQYGGDGVDFVDQLNYQFTSGMLIVFIVMIGFRQYVGKPLHCWVPQEFTSSWEDYAENLCWVQNTYFLLPNEAIPEEDFEMLRVRHISYYQWVAIVLAGQAMMAWVPQMFWRVWSKRVPVLLRNAREAAVPDKETRHKAISCLVAALEEVSEASRRFRRTRGVFKRCLRGAPPTTQITLLFLFVRFLFIANNVGQIYIMRRFIGTNDTMFGLHVFQELMTGSQWEVSGLFPRVTYCDVKVRKLGQLKPASYTLQCVLPVNYFIEKVYVFLWFWFILVAGITALNTLQWMFNVCVPYRRVYFIRQYLKALKQLSHTEETECARFVNNDLGCDGVFLLQAVSRISSDLIVLDVTGMLWSNYQRAKITGTEGDITRFIESINRVGGGAGV
uniref:Innexin n=1 Tax=Cryptocotyle lingua TaxID=66766 RepID=A0A7U0YF63_9TREM|nr:innexin 7 [Cryptocotyle lingua]